VNVPRKATDVVTEHRVTFGDLERVELNRLISLLEEDQDINLLMRILNAVALPLSLAGVGYLAYLGLTHFGSFENPLADTRAAQAASAAAAVAAAGFDVGADGTIATPIDPATGEVDQEALAQIEAIIRAANPTNPFGRAIFGGGLLSGFLFG
tara:strand:+ start:563 stop:1021 length:459 start_codon:yes stop_codon:yes gene_type:complete